MWMWLAAAIRTRYERQSIFRSMAIVIYGCDYGYVAMVVAVAVSVTVNVSSR